MPRDWPNYLSIKQLGNVKEILEILGQVPSWPPKSQISTAALENCQELISKHSLREHILLNFTIKLILLFYLFHNILSMSVPLTIQKTFLTTFKRDILYQHLCQGVDCCLFQEVLTILGNNYRPFFNNFYHSF